MPLDLDDLWLIDDKPFTISPNHALRVKEGDAVIGEDRGLSLGTYVNEGLIGARTTQKQRTWPMATLFLS